MFNKPQRNHFTAIIERTIGVFGILIVILFSNIVQDFSLDMLKKEYWLALSGELRAQELQSFLFAIGSLVLLIVIVSISFLRWRKTYFFIEDGNLIVERRTILKKYSKLPIANIATVNIERNIFERIFGTSKVKIDINSSTTANKTDFTFILDEILAEQFKKCLIDIRNYNAIQEYPLTSDKDIHTAVPSQETVIRFSAGQVIRHKLFSVPFVQIILVLSALLPSFLDNAFDEESVFTTIVLLAIGFTFSLIFGVFGYIGFTVSRDDRNFYINYGLIKKKSYTFEHDKINAVIVRQPLLARIFRLYSIEIAVIGLGNEQKETPQLCLLVNKTQLEHVLNACAKDFICTGKKIPSAKQALIPYFMNATILSLLSLFCLLLDFNYSAYLCVFITIISFAGAFFSYKTKAIAYDENVFVYSSGILSKKTVMLKYGNIQLAKINTNFILKKYNVATMNVSILSGASMAKHKTGYFNAKHFTEISDRVVIRPDILATNSFK